MIAEAWKDENKWIENSTGACPVHKGVLIDICTRNHTKLHGIPALTSLEGQLEATSAFWKIEGASNDIVKWRIHTPLDTILPAPTRPAPAMPYVKPSKQENVFVEVPEVDPASQSNVLKAFNRMTGHSLTVDELNTLKILMEEFGN